MNVHLAAAYAHARELGAQLRRLDEIDAWSELAPIVTDARRELGRIVLELAETQAGIEAALRTVLGYVDKTLDNVSDLAPDLPWKNAEVVALLADVRSLLLTGEVVPGTFVEVATPPPVPAVAAPHRPSLVGE